MRVLVIGAGAAGITTAKHLLEEGFEVEILEKRNSIGGLWDFDKTQSSVSSQTYATSSKTFLQFSDFPMKQEELAFPHHSSYVKYLKDYATAYNILPLIKFKHEVTRLEQKDLGWEVEIRNEHETYTENADAVAVCSGLHHVPLIPENLSSQNFSGLIIHSSLLKDTEKLRGKRVIVVGGGESAADVVKELAPIANNVYLSLRRGMAITRKWGMGGLPADYDLTRAKSWLPKEFLHDYNVSCRLQDKYSAFKTFYIFMGLPIFLLMLPFSKKAMNFLLSFFDWKTWQALFKKQQRHGKADGVEMSKACQEFCQEIPESEA